MEDENQHFKGTDCFHQDKSRGNFWGMCWEVVVFYRPLVPTC